MESFEGRCLFVCYSTGEMKDVRVCLMYPIMELHVPSNTDFVYSFQILSDCYTVLHIILLYNNSFLGDTMAMLLMNL